MSADFMRGDEQRHARWEEITVTISGESKGRCRDHSIKDRARKTADHTKTRIATTLAFCCLRLNLPEKRGEDRGCPIKKDERRWVMKKESIRGLSLYDLMAG